MELSSSFVELLSGFRCVFTEPTFRTFCYLMTGWVLSHRRKFITDMILVGRSYSGWASQQVPSVLQSVNMATRHDVESVSHVGNPSFRANGHDRSGRRRYFVSQARLDVVWCGNAPRPVDLQPGQAAGQLGARLGRGDVADLLPTMGPDQGLGFALGVLSL